MAEYFETELQEKGYCVIKDILTQTEIKDAYDEFHKWRTSIDNFDEIHKKVNPHSIYKYHQVGHQRHAWLIRTNKAIQDVFKTLWKTDQLVVSFDGSCYMPKELSKKDHSMSHSHSNSVLLEPNQSAELIWKFNANADLEAACNVPGHYEAGMIAKINNL